MNDPAAVSPAPEVLIIRDGLKGVLAKVQNCPAQCAAMPRSPNVARAYLTK